MPDGTDNEQPLEVVLIGSLSDVAAQQWDACAGAANPTLSHGFLKLLEDSGAATRDSGWMARHLAIRSPLDASRLLACAPLYVKSHSYGEYVFDWGWADAYERAGGRYYPKLQSAVPFTPVPGARLLVRPDLSPGEPTGDQLRQALLSAMVRLTGEHGLSSLHLTFCTAEEWQLGGEMGLLKRRGMQYHWENRGYRCFDDFLAKLTSRKRKNLRKEREAVARSGVTLRHLVGGEIKARHWRDFYGFYLATVDKKWAHAYLTQEFFEGLSSALGDRVLLVLAEKDGEPVAGAFNLIGKKRLYGRNWGCLEEFRFLHFEACYYQAIDFAIEQGLEVVEAGAQGEHKIQRGYLPVDTYSLHWIADPALAQPVSRFLTQERASLDQDRQYLLEHSPYRDDSGKEGPARR
ncbi:GNAT family N-acetyltransferase [Limibacillus sp. MBR-115]|uniref:GNAT family N-acetyltransferase n=1 Tax=Limibacillus sp. MBR-115 TaxID=3156465 RepID=UPI00339102DD